MVLDHESERSWLWAAIRMVAEKIGTSSETLRNWGRQAEVMGGLGLGRPLRNSTSSWSCVGSGRASEGEHRPAADIGLRRGSGPRPPTGRPCQIRTAVLLYALSIMLLSDGQ